MTQRGRINNPMKILAWNCQWLVKPKAIRSLGCLLSDTKPEILFLCEVKTLFSPLISKALSSHSLSNHTFVPPLGTAGGLILAWKGNINLKIINQHNSYLHISIPYDTDNIDWFATFVHTPSKPNLKSSFWSAISDLHIPPQTAWMIIGDFNAITSQTKKKCGNVFYSSPSNDLTTKLNNHGLIDLGFVGYPYSWSNKRAGKENIQERLYRGLGNSDWITLFHFATITHLPAISSYHNPIILKTTIDNSYPKPFRFENMWLDDPFCYDVVHNGWNHFVTGSPLFKLHARIRNVEKALKTWNANHFGSCQKRIKELKEKITLVQSLDNSVTNIGIDANLHVELDIWLHRTEILWMQKAKNRWLKDDDANTKFFHFTVLIHSTHNRISFIRNMNNMVFSDFNGIGCCFLNYYKELFLSSYSSVSIPCPDNLDNLYSPCIDIVCFVISPLLHASRILYSPLKVTKVLALLVFLLISSKIYGKLLIVLLWRWSNISSKLAIF